MIKKTCLFIFLFSSMAVQGSYLDEDNLVHVIAPGFGIPKSNLIKIQKNLESLGVKSDIPKDLLNEEHMGLMDHANTEEYRGNHLKNLLALDKCRVIWSIRGGRGSSALLEGMKNLTPSSPKLFVGFSDITALHLYAQTKSWASLHGVVLNCNKEMGSSVNSETSLEDIKNILNGKTKELSYTLFPSNKAAKTENIILNSSIIGGNLSLLQRSIGTYTQPSTKDKIFLIEDTGDSSTRVYENLTHLDRVGLFDEVEGIIWGNFCPEKNEIEKYKYLKKQFSEKMDERGTPVFSSDRFGHGPYNDPLVFNTPTKVVMDGGDEVTIKIKTTKE